MLDDEVGEGVGEAELDAGGGGFEAAGEGGGEAALNHQHGRDKLGVV